jgi:hypothetical protein
MGNMKKELLTIIILVMLLSLICGCQSTQVENNNYNYIFESDVVTLTNYSMELNENKLGVVTKAVVNGRIENALNRGDETISVIITAKFFDSNDDLLGEKNFTIIGLRSKGKTGSSTTFTIIYEEENVAQIDHLKLYAVEKID